MRNAQIAIGSRVHAREGADSMTGTVLGIERDLYNTPLTMLVMDPMSERTQLFNLYDSGVSISRICDLPN